MANESPHDWLNTADGREARGDYGVTPALREAGKGGAYVDPDFGKPRDPLELDRAMPIARGEGRFPLDGEDRPRDLKQTAGKAQLSQHPRVPMIWGARVRAYGAKKYARGNYLRRAEDGHQTQLRRASNYADAILRHLLVQTDLWERTYGAAEDGAGGAARDSRHRDLAVDSESGLPHLAHALVSLEMLIAQMADAGLAPVDPGEGNEPPKQEAK